MFYTIESIRPDDHLHQWYGKQEKKHLSPPNTTNSFHLRHSHYRLWPFSQRWQSMKASSFRPHRSFIVKLNDEYFSGFHLHAKFARRGEDTLDLIYYKNVAANLGVLTDRLSGTRTSLYLLVILHSSLCLDLLEATFCFLVCTVCHVQVWKLLETCTWLWGSTVVLWATH